MGSEIVITCGIPGSGKSTAIAPFVASGYTRLNRDTLGGTLDGIAAKLEAAIISQSGGLYVLDNTYPTKALRAKVLSIGAKYGIPVKCLWLKTSLEDAQFNAALRMVRKYGRILEPDEIKIKTKEDPNCFQMGILYQYRKNFEEPTKEEGFSEVTKVPFVRNDPADYTNKALFLDYDGTLRNTKSGEKFPVTLDDIEILPNRQAVIKNYEKAGYIIVGISNQSGVAKGDLTLERAHELFKETNRKLGINIDYRFCPHQSNPIVCYCRKPGTGFAAEFIEKYKLNRSECIMVGDMTTDKTFATRAGFKYFDAEDFFALCD